MEENIFLIPAAILRNREAQYIQFLLNAVTIKQCNAITTKNEFSLYRKSRESRDEKKKWIGKINKITKKLSRGSFVKQTVDTVYLT